MKKLIAAALLALALPASAMAAEPTATEKRNAREACRAERAANPALFKETYRGLGNCVAKRAKAEKEIAQNAAQQCATERSQDPAAFKQRYGTNENGANAMGKCVSGKAKAQRDEQTEANVNAAKTCKALRRADRAKFARDFGSGRNAFGRCVSRTASEQQDD